MKHETIKKKASQNRLQGLTRSILSLRQLVDFQAEISIDSS
jgi:hypothetical protein